MFRNIYIYISTYFVNHPEAGVELDHSIFQVICILQSPPCISDTETQVFLPLSKS